MSCCGGNCGCGSDCKCGNGCGGCKKMYPDLEGTTSSSSTTETFIAGVAPKINAYYTEMGNVVGGTENGGTCKCGDNCTCNPCNCDK